MSCFLHSLTIVSIHAPARGATDVRVIIGVVCLFQSTPPHGERPVRLPTKAKEIWFQSTPPHGERPNVGHQINHVGEFQSTPPHGERQERDRNGGECKMFQSTPPHGERLLQANTLCGNAKKTGWREPYPALLVKNSY